MHPEAYAGFRDMAVRAGLDFDAPYDILDIGGQNVNGTVHDLFPNATFTTLDLENADIIADARVWGPTRSFDVVIATEVFEHVAEWDLVIGTMKNALAKGGVIISTMASVNRQAHGATGAPAPAPGEWYENIDPDELSHYLSIYFGEDFETRYLYPPGDLYCWARL